MAKKTKIFTFIFSLCGILLLIDANSKNNIVLGYGYDRVTPPEIQIDTIITQDKTPAISGRYIHGPVKKIDIVIKDSSNNLVWSGQPTYIANMNAITGTWQNWNVADNTFDLAKTGSYEITATVTDAANMTATAKSTLGIKNDFSLTSVTLESNDSSDKKTMKDKAVVKIKNYGEATHYMISSNSDFKGASWKNVRSAISVKVSTDEEGEQKFYIKLRDSIGTESEVFTKSITYVKPRKISVSAKSVSRGETLIQRGKRFSKNSNALLYFSKNTAGYSVPMKVKTDSKGAFTVNYKVNKPSGNYIWYAVDEKTGKRSNTSKYTVR